jgi:hypothetical protein
VKTGDPGPEFTGLDSVLLRKRWNDPVQAQILDELSIVVGDVPDRNDGDTEFGIRSGITTFNAVERVRCCKRGENAVRVVERVLEIFDQLGFCFRRIVATFFAVVRRFLALELIKEGKLSASDMLHLFTETPNTFEISGGWDERILVLGHGFSNTDKIPFHKLKCAANAFRDGLGNVI